MAASYLGDAEQPEGEEQRQHLTPIGGKVRTAQPDKAHHEPAQEDERRCLRVDVGDKVLQKRVAEDAQPVGRGLPQGQAGKPVQQQNQRTVGVGVFRPEVGARQHFQRYKLARQKQRPREENVDVIQLDPADKPQRGGKQFGQIVVGEPHARKADVLRREVLAQRGGVAHVPQHVLIEVYRPGGGGEGVDRPEPHRVQKAEQRPEQPGVAVQQIDEPARRARDVQRAAVVSPDKPEQYQHGRQQPQQPDDAQPHTDAVQRGQKAAAVHRRVQPGQTALLRRKPIGQRPAGQNQIDRAARREEQHGKGHPTPAQRGSAQPAQQGKAGQQAAQQHPTARLDGRARCIQYSGGHRETPLLQSFQQSDLRQTILFTTLV